MSAELSTLSKISKIDQEIFFLGILPTALELLLYGVFLTIFLLNIYVFRYKLMPGKLYIIATFIFFILATSSVVVDLLGRKIITSSWINFLLADSDVIQVVSFQDLVSFIEGSQKLNAAGSWIFFSSSILGDLILIYRCYRLWNSKKYVIILPVLFLLTTLGIFAQVIPVA
ncbi:hypothetical protein BT96DRAFT_382879 [Gymnopus androsaceus JB14]|uniref:Uncharacterized protein n=1 Tax=Gymnopus androsaceus JB14 TaxID=1447944 RepID=A0A6A4INY2_9AGAR|nr:hypothetical protein BT96DRAFT_382879 [Gymnopus androsaceus JB14]